MDSGEVKSGWISRLRGLLRRSDAIPWQDLTQDEYDSGYGKSTLRAVIERRRRNDLVRRREFDLLRQLRQRGLQSRQTESDDHVSLFHGSQFSALDEREKTLQKIDEIEAQMSRQWWSGTTANAIVAPAPAPMVASTAEVEPGSDSDSDFASTRMDGPLTEAELAPAPAATAARWGPQRRHLSVTPVRFAEIDPELAEAALRLASGHADEAEAILRAAVARAADGHEDRARLWRAALGELPSAPTLRAEADGGYELVGELTGDITAWLPRCANDEDPTRMLVLSCARLQRLDFSAAGVLLNWLQECRAPVEFRDVGILMTAFFRLLGIDELARMTVRTA